MNETTFPEHESTDRLRVALGELLALSNHGAQALRQDREHYQRSLSEARDALAGARKAAEGKREHDHASSQREHDERKQKVQGIYAYERRTSESQYHATRESLTEESDQNVRTARESKNQKVWLAESVCEAGQNELRGKIVDLQHALEEHCSALEQLHSDAKVLIKRMGVELPETHVVPRQNYESAELAAPEDVIEDYRETFERQVTNLRQLAKRRWVAKGGVYGAIALTIGAALAGGAALSMHIMPLWIVAAAMIVLAIGLAVWTWLGVKARKNLAIAAYQPLPQRLVDAPHIAEQGIQRAAAIAEAQRQKLVAKREQDVAAAKATIEPIELELSRRRETVLAEIEQKYQAYLRQIAEKRDLDVAILKQWLAKRKKKIDRVCKVALAEAQRQYEQTTSQLDQRFDTRGRDVADLWAEGVGHATQVIDAVNAADEKVAADWASEHWQNWTGGDAEASSAIRFGHVTIDLSEIARGLKTKIDPATIQPPTRRVPAMLNLPHAGSLFIQADRDGRAAATGALQSVMGRLLTCLPPGQVRFTLIDPIGRGESFAGFMHLADHDEELIGLRIWTERDHINHRLADLTEHMENVIQKYLRNEYETIDQYNAQAGELAEPYRFLVVADFPANFTDDAATRLASIVSTGPRCGVYTLMVADPRLPLPQGVSFADFKSQCVTVLQQGDQFVWQDDVFQHFPLALDSPPSAKTLQHLLGAVGEKAKDFSRVELPFESIAPATSEMWSGDSGEELSVPIGRTGATRLQRMALGQGVAQHVLIAGKTGSGKSTLLHVLITNLALWYSPDQVEFYLIDFKKGVEFKTYATHRLPHARAVAIESDREFGLSVLQRIDAEMRRRGDLYRDHGVQDVAGFRAAAPDIAMPRTLLVIDEFQEFFSEDDKLAQDAALLLDRLVRQGRAFGIHVVLGTQTLAGAYGLARSTIGQMAVRVALQCSEADSLLILSDTNAAARLLSRPGEAIYNDVGGLVEGNSPFQISWLNEKQREQQLARVADEAAAYGHALPSPPIVFEGNAPAHVQSNDALGTLLSSDRWMGDVPAPLLWLGEPIAIKSPTAAKFQRQSGSNLLIVGQRDEAALGMMLVSFLALAAQHAPDMAAFSVFDGSPADSPHHGRLKELADALPHNAEAVQWRQVGDAMGHVHQLLKQRQENNVDDAPAHYMLIHGLQRYRMLARSEDDFSFSATDEPAAAKPDKQLADLLRDGPSVGIHTLLWCDAPSVLLRMLDRSSLREFDGRVLFQMSASDSTHLIDSPVAGKLGLHRALFFSEEHGMFERFRPYVLPESDWLADMAAALRNRA